MYLLEISLYVIRPEASPHEYTLRPSEAQALSQADIVFWVSEGLTPWLEKPLSSLASSATKIEMMEVDGMTLHDFREGATFEAHEHHGEGHEHDEGHDDDHHEEHHHDDHDDGHEDDHQEGHHHEGHDPHVWLDPKNAEVWVNTIANALSPCRPRTCADLSDQRKNRHCSVAQTHCGY